MIMVDLMAATTDVTMAACSAVTMADMKAVVTAGLKAALMADSWATIEGTHLVEQSVVSQAEMSVEMSVGETAY